MQAIDAGRPVSRLNELEFVNDQVRAGLAAALPESGPAADPGRGPQIWANVWTTECIAVIDPNGTLA